MRTVRKDTEGVFYCVNHKGWQAFIDAHEEGRFLLECYRQIGHLLDSNFANMVFEIDDVDRKHLNRIERKFLHLVKINAQKTDSSRKILNAVIEGLISEKQLEITYDGGLRVVRPYTLCQHRDDLYLMGYRMKDGGQWEKRTYKLARITGIKVLDRKFPYPTKKDWDPVQEYQKSSGLVLGEEKTAQIRVYGISRKVIAEKDFFGGELINRDKDFDTYSCTYTNIHEFLGQLFVYAQDIEIVDDEELKEAFVNKAQAGLLRNQISKIKSG
jgi:predicted DNA-binding transcriptional regulator YafY